MTIHGYAYDAALPESPVTLDDLRLLQRAVGWTDADEKALREAGAILPARVDRMLEHWLGVFGEIFLSAFAGPDGKPIESYVHAVHPRFVQWVKDTCERPMDARWLAAQHELGLRHHRAKKNRTDPAARASVVPVVPMRYLVALVHPMSDVRTFLREGGASEPDAEAMSAAWGKALAIQVSLWTRPYSPDW